ncbi:hypothetical protein E2562_039498 [Oryza meyeriana var. granulata]|uniref:Uncharacterized protein n=1 Tax=Oryza meyeriana var. granulata TaxID=110450 RepID=A0A6G1ECR9_9ORYZ|nr:hypothetical protein E2562_039498 [Oryza meyeriana var. granulata]
MTVLIGEEVIAGACGLMQHMATLLAHWQATRCPCGLMWRRASTDVTTGHAGDSKGATRRKIKVELRWSGATLCFAHE